MNEKHANIFAQAAVGLSLVASAFAEAAQTLSETVATPTDRGGRTELPGVVHRSIDNIGQLSLSPGINDGRDPMSEAGSSDANSVGSNDGNNAHCRSIPSEVSLREDAAFAPGSSPSQEHHEYFGWQEHELDFLGRLICPGHFSLVLEDEFDALPLIMAYATTGKKTVCYIPTSGSLEPWLAIISTIIPNHLIWSSMSLSENDISELSGIIEQFAESDHSSILLLRPGFAAWANEHQAHSISDSVIFWGLPGQKFWPTIVGATQQSRHILLILSRREYVEPTCQNFFMRDSSFLIHPRYSELSLIGQDSPLENVREFVQYTLAEPQYSQYIQSIGDGLETNVDDSTRLCFTIGPTWERMDAVDEFMSQVFLRGTLENNMLPIPEKKDNRPSIKYVTQPRKSKSKNKAKNNATKAQGNTPRSRGRGR
ncbi:hypothetical protein B0J17DRAFT_682230 [Rhizoctonia solani]|nr:hypothetical protein B0J17DRAFT_682230 [Rhizoctonia solani]